MIRKMLTFVVSLLQFSSFAGEGFHSTKNQAPESIKPYLDSVAMITVNLNDPKSYTAGSGLVFYSDSEFSYIVTNHHVAGYGCKNIGNKCDDLNIRFGFEWNNNLKEFNVVSSTPSIIAEVILDYDDPVQDIAVVKFKTGNLKFKKINLITDIELIPESGDFHAIGYPILSLRDKSDQIINQKWSTGSLKMLANDATLSGGVKGTFFLHDIDLVPGMSGGPVFDSMGNLIGIQQSVALINGEDYKFSNYQFCIAVPLSVAREYFTKFTKH